MIAWIALGVALAAYEQWLATPDTDLESLLRSGGDLIIGAVDRSSPAR